MNKVAAFLVALVIAAVVGLLVVAGGWPVINLPTEIAKSLLQLGVIAAAGHVVSILITKANNERQDLMRADDLRVALLDRLNESFIDVKKVRRLARATSEKVMIGGVVYMFIHKTKFHDYLQLLNDAQLELELVSKDVESNKSLFVDAKEVIKRLDMMEEYLNRLVDEYENSSVKTVNDPVDCFPVASFPRLSDLLGPYKVSEFRKEFVHTYYANLESVRRAFSRMTAKGG
ncbi:hypothetical protein GCM10027277_08330 [Pseudoduganella ginsengisoli]|uniref:Uncharacterized protein n=1 Tax=Pseudoduganella ginsengisoli TaxID=1462440 RepID=A0A6L6Q075_9BURK|nr:hypothetical protein [Pseudoduganella ginsengisoli]MTW03227.1 hypothetical protein [Pseudoduganella ginsengisoli]